MNSVYCSIHPDYTALYNYYVRTPYYKQVGKKDYELTNHLGNVITTINDKKIGLDEDGDNIIDISHSTTIVLPSTDIKNKDDFPNIVIVGRQVKIAI